MTLVATVVARKTAVQRSSRLELRNPYITSTPELIPIRLIRTCSRVNVEVLIPRIIVHLHVVRAFYALPTTVLSHKYGDIAVAHVVSYK